MFLYPKSKDKYFVAGTVLPPILRISFSQLRCLYVATLRFLTKVKHHLPRKTHIQLLEFTFKRPNKQQNTNNIQQRQMMFFMMHGVLIKSY